MPLFVKKKTCFLIHTMSMGQALELKVEGDYKSYIEIIEILNNKKTALAAAPDVELREATKFQKDPFLEIFS